MVLLLSFQKKKGKSVLSKDCQCGVVCACACVQSNFLVWNQDRIDL